jgi:vacuolar-type H+-ATPase catalytic subunit A/Vma1
MFIKRKDLLNVYFAIKSLSNTSDYSKWFVYLITETEEKIKNVVSAILSVSKPKDEYLEYEKLRDQIIKKYAERNDDDEFIIDNDYIKIDERYKDQIQDEFKNLDLEYNDVTEVRKKDVAEYKELLNSEIDVDLEQIDFKYFPDNISKKIYLALKPLIKKDN